MTDPRSYLFGLEQFGIKFGLENMRAIVERLGHPERAFRSVHIAGTNGKGSVTAMIDAGLRAAGHRSARYTSPHLVTLAERFTIEGKPVDEDALDAAIADVRTAVEGLLLDGVLQAHPTFFEVTTAVAFELFRRAGIEIAVVEVGLGGRLDATNVIDPVLTAITSIAFDHEQYLGSTLAAIAAEKAGIIKPRVPVVVGELDAEAFAAIDAVARERDAPLVHASEGVDMVPQRAKRSARAPASAHEEPTATATWDDATTIHLRTALRDYGSVSLGLRGAHQVSNALIAVRMLELLDTGGITVPSTAVLSALARPSWPGRLEWRRVAGGRALLLDAAHNPAGAAALASYLHEHVGTPLPLVFAAMHDKDIDGMLRALLPAVGRLVLTRASNRRSADPDVLAERARRIDPHVSFTIVAGPAQALEVAWQLSPRIIVAGSIFLLGDVMGGLGGS